MKIKKIENYLYSCKFDWQTRKKWINVTTEPPNNKPFFEPFFENYIDTSKHPMPRSAMCTNQLCFDLVRSKDPEHFCWAGQGRGQSTNGLEQRRVGRERCLARSFRPWLFHLRALCSLLYTYIRHTYSIAIDSQTWNRPFVTLSTSIPPSLGRLMLCYAMLCYAMVLCISRRVPAKHTLVGTFQKGLAESSQNPSLFVHSFFWHWQIRTFWPSRFGAISFCIAKF